MKKFIILLFVFLGSHRVSAQLGTVLNIASKAAGAGNDVRDLAVEAEMKKMSALQIVMKSLQVASNATQDKSLQQISAAGNMLGSQLKLFTDTYSTGNNPGNTGASLNKLQQFLNYTARVLMLSKIVSDSYLQIQSYSKYYDVNKALQYSSMMSSAMTLISNSTKLASTANNDKVLINMKDRLDIIDKSNNQLDGAEDAVNRLKIQLDRDKRKYEDRLAQDQATDMLYN